MACSMISDVLKPVHYRYKNRYMNRVFPEPSFVDKESLECLGGFPNDVWELPELGIGQLEPRWCRSYCISMCSWSSCTPSNRSKLESDVARAKLCVLMHSRWTGLWWSAFDFFFRRKLLNSLPALSRKLPGIKKSKDHKYCSNFIFR